MVFRQFPHSQHSNIHFNFFFFVSPHSSPQLTNLYQSQISWSSLPCIVLHTRSLLYHPHKLGLLHGTSLHIHTTFCSSITLSHFPYKVPPFSSFFLLFPPILSLPFIQFSNFHICIILGKRKRIRKENENEKKKDEVQEEGTKRKNTANIMYYDKSFERER